MLLWRYFSSNLFKAIALLLASISAWYLGYLIAASLPDETLTIAMNNIQKIGEKPVLQAPNPKRQKCDHWAACPEDTYAFRLVTGGGTMKHPKICFEDELLISETKKNTGRGLNVVVIDYATGKVVRVTNFDTYEKDVSEDLIKCLKETPPKAIIFIVTHDEASTKLKEGAKKALEELGSKKIRTLGFRSAWCFLAFKGGKLPDDFEQEKIIHSDDKNRYSGWPSELQIDGCIPKP
uniref:Protein FAM3B isoform X2 n=1 Tax=Geotrypetes seraphini TaxID=260995 RepID=A0A6P8QHY9_GEOSA|nr:protein FAM3B isoform X2 [Geotrypetes seraphini]